MASLSFKGRFLSLIVALLLPLSGLLSQAIPPSRAAGPAPKKAAPKLQTLTFPNVPVATFDIAIPGVDKLGAPTFSYARYLARGKMQLPTEGSINLLLKYDGVEHLDTLAQLDPGRVMQINAAGLELDDKGLSFFTRFRSVFRINLDSTIITDKSIPTLAAFKNLRDLRISKTDISGDNLGALDGLPFVVLNMDGSSIKEGSLSKIKSLPKTLTSINVAKTSIGPADIAFIAKCQKLNSIDLSGDKKVTDACMKDLSKLKNVDTLLLTDSSVTEASLPLLAKMPGLKRLVVRYRTFWKTGNGKSPRPSLQIIDAVNDSRTPIDVFDPLHPNF